MTERILNQLESDHKYYEQVKSDTIREIQRLQRFVETLNVRQSMILASINFDRNKNMEQTIRSHMDKPITNNKPLNEQMKSQKLEVLLNELFKTLESK